MKPLLFSARLAAGLTALFLSSPAMKADQSGYYYFTNTGSSAIITNYTGPGGFVSIPPTLNTLPVAGIGYSAFFAQNGMTGVSIPSSVDSIGDHAFHGCSGLASIAIPSSVTNLGSWVFAYCAHLGSVTISNGVTDVGDYDFQSCSSLSNVNLGGAIRTIGVNAFDFCTNLTAITIPGGLTDIGDSAFADCLALTNIDLPDCETNLGNYAFYDCGNLSSAAMGKNINTLGNNVFSGCTNLASLFFGGNAPTNIGQDMFSNSAPTVYFLAGTTNWSGGFAGQPAILWNPQVLPCKTNLHGQFGLCVTGSINLPIVLESASNLHSASWSTRLRCTLTNGLVIFGEPNPAGQAQNYYRVRSP